MPEAVSTPARAGVVVPYPSVPDVQDVIWQDEAGEVAGTLMRWGVRHYLLRWIPRSTLLDLWREVRSYRPPANTRACWEGGRVWLAEIAVPRIEAQTWQRRRKDTWIAVGTEYAASCLEGHPPLTRATQNRVAERIGITPRYVSSILRWYQDQGLLGQVLGGTRTKRVEIPAGETDEEREARLATEAAAMAARRERIAARKALLRASRNHARAELAAVAAGEPIPPPPDAFEEFHPGKVVMDAAPPDEPNLDEVLALRLATVYELRAPAATEPAALSAVVVDLRAERSRRRPAPGSGGDDKSRNSAGPAATEQQTAAAPTHLTLVPTPSCPDAENFLPNPVDQEDLLAPNDQGDVDKEQNRGASRRSDKKSSSVIDFLPGRKQSTDHRSRAEHAAARLLGRAEQPQASDKDRLPQRLTWGVSVAWLAPRIRPHVDANWTDGELVWWITTRGGRYPFLPVHIRTPKAVITTSLAAADPAIRPHVRAAVAQIEANNRDAAQRRHDQITAQRRERARTRQAAIDACRHCDEHGWTLLDGAGPEVRCDHPTSDQHTKPPNLATTPDDRAARLAKQRAARAAAASARDEQRRRLVEQARAELAARSDGRAGDIAQLLAASADSAGRTAEERHRLAVERARAERGRHRP